MIIDERAGERISRRGAENAEGSGPQIDADLKGRIWSADLRG